MWIVIAVALYLLVSFQLASSPVESIATINIWKHRYPFHGGYGGYYPFWGGYGGYGGYGGISINKGYGRR